MRKKLTIEDVKDSLGVHVSDFNTDDLVMELHRLPKILCENIVAPLARDQITVADIQKKMVMYDETVRNVFSEVCRLLALTATIPASVATAERSHSALKRLKTYLRSTMTESRLTHLLLLHVHKQETATLDLDTIFREFAVRNTERRNVFGK